MRRLFPYVAGSEVLLFCGAAVLGLMSSDQVGQMRHIGLALFASLLACLMHAIVFTYFTVTGKLIHQAIALGEMDPVPIVRAKAFKRNTSVLVGVGMFSVLVTVAAGAARLANPDAGYWHLLSAGVLVPVQGVVLFRQYVLIVRNDTLLTDTLAQYRAGRAERASAS